MHSPEPAPDKLAESSALHAAERAAMRREKIAAREALDPDQHRRISQTLEAHLQRLLRSCRPRILGFCWPIRSEFDCRQVAQRLLSEGVPCCLPLVSTVQAAMDFRAWQPGGAMLLDRYGIPYPAAGASLVPDVLLMPVNAFDAAGYRLGYGSGYFDRTLARLAAHGAHPLAIGVGFELARVASIHPAAHDVPLDAVVTEAGVTRFSARLPAE